MPAWVNLLTEAGTLKGPPTKIVAQQVAHIGPISPHRIYTQVRVSFSTHSLAQPSPSVSPSDTPPSLPPSARRPRRLSLSRRGTPALSPSLVVAHPPSLPLPAWRAAATGGGTTRHGGCGGRSPPRAPGGGWRRVDLGAATSGGLKHSASRRRGRARAKLPLPLLLL